MSIEDAEIIPEGKIEVIAEMEVPDDITDNVSILLSCRMSDTDFRLFVSGLNVVQIAAYNIVRNHCLDKQNHYMHLSSPKQQSLRLFCSGAGGTGNSFWVAIIR